MNRLVPVSTRDGIFPDIRDTPIGDMVEYHNLKRPFDSYTRAQLLIGLCMDYRNYLRIPENFAYILRAGGANLRYSEFKVSYAIAIGGVKYIALIGHSNCGMVNLMSKRDSFIQGLVENAGWEKEWAEAHFMHFAPMFEIGNEIDFILSEAGRLQLRYPRIRVEPLMYGVEDNLLYLIKRKKMVHPKRPQRGILKLLK